MKRIFIAGASSGIGLAIAAHKNGHDAPDKRGGIALEQAANAALMMIARYASAESETGHASQGRSQQRRLWRIPLFVLLATV